MRVVAADFDETFAAKEKNLDKHPAVCEPGECFVGSYAPVSKPGVPGKWNNNSYFLQDTRRHEVVGAVPVRSRDFKFK